MLKHEAKLIDPTPEEIESAVGETKTAANKRCRTRLLAEMGEPARKFARDTAKAPEGYAMFRGGKGGIPATQVLAAWWTDAAGRKHVVLRGRRIEHTEAKRLLQKDELEKRPAPWHAYPEYVCRRTVGKESQIVCACGCGAVGTPESLGWMGETCGPCFDRKEEVGAGALRANLPGVLYGDRDPLGAVACSPDGTRVAAVEGDNCVTYWDIPARMRTVMKFSGARVRDVAITPDARHLLVVGMGTSYPQFGLFAAFDLSTDPPTRVDPASETGPNGWRVAALPDSALALRQRVNFPSQGGRVDVVRVPSGEVVRNLAFTVGALGRFAVSSDGRRLATCASEMAVYDLTGPQARALSVRDTMPPQFVAFGPGGRQFGAFIGSVVEFRDANTFVAESRLDGKLGGMPFEIATALAVDPAGESVYVGSRQGKVCVFAANGLKLRAVFEWHLGAITSLAVSADGSRLFSSGDDGCVKVWPIRDLLKGV